MRFFLAETAGHGRNPDARDGPAGLGGRRAERVAALLELVASQHPDLLDFQLETISTGPMRLFLYELAADFDVLPEKVGETVLGACRDLETLEQRRRGWREPGQVLDSPNLAALFCVCRARLVRTPRADRQRRLGAILRKLKRAHERAKTRAWIEDFIGLEKTIPGDHG